LFDIASSFGLCPGYFKLADVHQETSSEQQGLVFNRTLSCESACQTLFASQSDLHERHWFFGNGGNDVVFSVEHVHAEFTPADSKGPALAEQGDGTRVGL